jgi:hypothetical protein
MMMVIPQECTECADLAEAPTWPKASKTVGYSGFWAGRPGPGWLAGRAHPENHCLEQHFWQGGRTPAADFSKSGENRWLEQLLGGGKMSTN